MYKVKRDVVNNWHYFLIHNDNQCMVQYPIKISEENSKTSWFCSCSKLKSISSHFRARTLKAMLLHNNRSGCNQLSRLVLVSILATISTLACTRSGHLILLLESDCSGSIRCKRIRKSLGTDPLLDRQSWGSLPRLWRTTRSSRPSRRRSSSSSFHFFHTRLIPAPDSPSSSGTSGPRWRRTEWEWRTRGRRLKVFASFQSSNIFAFPDLKQKVRRQNCSEICIFWTMN